MNFILNNFAKATEGISDWCPPAKSWSLLSMVIALRPKVVCEIGVWAGGSCIPMALAAKALGTWIDPVNDRESHCRVVAIDAWSAEASIENQIPVNAEWWGRQGPHEWAYREFMSRIEKFELGKHVEIIRKKSSEAPPPANIGLLHIDGNHSDLAVDDVMRFGPNVRPGGMVVMDDLHWSGGGVKRAAEHLQSMGFKPLYDLDDSDHNPCTRVFQRQGIK